MRNLRRTRHHGAEVPTHAMNDIMFFLLLFFLIISTMTNPYMIKIFTAGTGTLTEREKKEKKYELVVTAEKEYVYNNQKVSVEQLEKLIVADHNMNPEHMVLAIDLHPDVDIQEMIDVLSLCTESGIKFYLKDPQA
jgi:biopolymer transport protein ExbD